ncbi:MAG TPA: HupE/UreJ family protein [Pseudolabrys sp.]|nr:HupE/UreJ family protein [Pseudolabrys sp.]
MKRLVPIAMLLVLAAGPAVAHVGHGSTTSFTAGLGHPLGGLDHVTVMVMVGLWAGLKGGRALWVWPAVFVGVMLVGGVVGMEGVPVPFVEPGILASVVALGLLVALAVDLPVAVGAGILAVFAVFHGHAHGSEVADTLNGVEYMAGFALATAALHLAGIGFAATMTHFSLRPAIRVVGALCLPIGAGLYAGVF